MIQASGTKQEWESELIDFIRKLIPTEGQWMVNKIKDKIESNGWITKPEWEQAYNEYYNRHIDFKPDKLLGLMRARITELEAKGGL